MSRISKNFFGYLMIFLVLLGLIILNYFHISIESRLPFAAQGIIPAFSLFCITALVLFFYTKEKRLESIKYEFITVATHKFRTPLSILKWLVEDIKKEQTIVERQDTVKQLEGAIDRLREIVELLSGAVKIDDRPDYAFTSLALRESIDKSLVKYGPIIHKKEIQFRIDCDSDLPLVIVDSQKIQFAIDMILENAIRYTPAKGFVLISVKYQNGKIILAVKDSGIGLTRLEKAYLFSRFYRGDEAKRMDTEGMGLGLSIAKVIVNNHGGKLWAESDGRGKGSTFFIKLKTQWR